MKSAGLLGILAFVASSFVATVVSASPTGEYFATHPGIFESTSSTAQVGKPWHVSFAIPSPPAQLQIDPELAVRETQQDNQRPVAFEYSDAYNVRRKIHMLASYTTIPLFVAQYVAGEKLFDDPQNSSAKSAHGALTIGIATLFAINTVTGGWNFLEARKDPNGRKRRLIHSLMMLGADIGFVATGALAPDDDDEGSKSTHRTVAISSMGVSVASYLYMLVSR